MRGCETKALSKEAPVSLVPWLDLLQPLSCLLTCPTFDSFLTILTGWAFARRTATGIAAGAAGEGFKAPQRLPPRLRRRPPIPAQQNRRRN